MDDFHSDPDRVDTLKPSPLAVLEKITALEPIFPDSEKGIGRNCFAFSYREDAAFQIVRSQAREIIVRHNLRPDEYEIKTDAIGNLFITIFGKNRDSLVLSGSHVDSVMNGGKYDGVAGVVSALNFLPTAIASRREMENSYQVVVWRAEESSPTTGVACLGSRVATGSITEAQLNAIQYQDGDEKIPLSVHIDNKWGAGAWEKVLAEAKNPPVSAKTHKAAEELHIEQSEVGVTLGAKVGIVIEGIGGAIRQTMRVPLEGKEIIPEAGMTEYTLTIKGKEAHTGGTPPNWHADWTSAKTWFRSDALIGAVKIMEKLVTLRDPFHLLDVSVPQDTGFTTVPGEEVIRILGPNTGDFIRDLSLAIDLVEEDLQVKLRTYEQAPTAAQIARKADPAYQRAFAMAVKLAEKGFNTELLADIVTEETPKLKWKCEPVENRKYMVVPPEAFVLLEIPVLLERLIREKVNQDREVLGGVGKVRGTVTDFRLSPDELTCKVDLRDVDPVQMQSIRDGFENGLVHLVEKALSNTSRVQIDTVLKTVGRKSFVPLDEQIICTKRQIATALGLKSDEVVEMPSLPGHDVANLSEAGIRSGMTFVVHRNGSHNPREAMEEVDFLLAQKLSHATLAKELGIPSH